MNHPKVYNKHHKDAPPDAVFIGRPSRWGNPYPITETCTRDQAIELFERDVEDDPTFRKLIRRYLRGRSLVCFCKPKRCHGDVLLRVANEPDEENEVTMMKTQSLAVKYRPNRLIDLIGQDHIVAQIKGAFKKGRMPSSIMLSGSTGLGKTTVARMLARMLHCSKFNKTTLEPCGECANCRMQDHPDITELNAADTRGIDDIRSLIQQSKNMPTMGSKKLIIIDECHQLTSQAQQALLKPVEEPPGNTLWIFCSMSVDKVLPAITKRCLQMQVRPVEPEAIARRLYKIAKAEGVDFKTLTDGTKILKTIGDFANGGVRESIQLLESVLLAYESGTEIDLNTVLQKFLLVGEADAETGAANILLAILSGNLKNLVAAFPSDNPRTVLNKLRWLIDYLINNSAGKAKFVPYSGRIFSREAKRVSLRVNLANLLQIQHLLVETEFRLNSINIDERVVLMSALGNFAATVIKTKE